jgi:uncharacterized protein
MNPALLADALTVPVKHEPFEADQLVAGEPTSGWLPLAGIDGIEVGIWEMTPGTITDIEADEVLCVLAGEALIEFLEPSAESIELRPGSLVRLQVGWRTRWTVTQTVRKIAVTREEV